MDQAVCSFIVVNWNGRRHLKACFDSILRQQYPEHLLDVTLVDNGSRDDSVAYVNRVYPTVRTLRNTENNFAAALNLGTRASGGGYVAFVNNDVVLDRRWLPTLVETLASNDRAGAAGGKILLKNGRINSAGVEELANSFWRDVGFDEADDGQYDEARPVDALCWAAVLFRRECLDSVGDVDEDFVIYCEDVDFSTRCRAKGWSLEYVPGALAWHEYRASSSGSSLTDYFVNRNRFLYLAKHRPRELPGAIRTSHFFLNNRRDLVWECMPATIKMVLEHQPPVVAEAVLRELADELASLYGRLAVDHLIGRLQVALGHRKMSLGIYDYAMHVIGGGQKYASMIASVVQDDLDVTFIANKPTSLREVESWYNVTLPKCRVKVVPLAFFEARGREWIDSDMVTEDIDNPFEVIAEESAGYDVFINANMLEKVRPLSPVSIFICHFPERYRAAYFAVDDYALVVNNSAYGQEWTKRRWGIDTALVLYPAVEMEAPPAEKETILLSVARFESGGTKKQLELVKTFGRLVTSYPDDMRGWRLVMVGGSLADNPYLEKVAGAAEECRGRVELKVNAPFAEMQELYARASIFWHACGIGETNPHWVEHFGMTTVEAMQNRCVPVVFDGGGQREVVEHGRSGFLFATLDELAQHTIALVRDRGLLTRIQEGAWERSQRFRRPAFEQKVRKLFDLIRSEYAEIRRPDPAEVMNRLR